MLSSEFNRLDLLFELLAMKSVRTDTTDSVPHDEGAAIPRDDQKSWHQSSFDLSRGCNVSEQSLDELPADLLDQLVAQASRAKARGA